MTQLLAQAFADVVRLDPPPAVDAIELATPAGTFIKTISCPLEGGVHRPLYVRHEGRLFRHYWGATRVRTAQYRRVDDIMEL